MINIFIYLFPANFNNTCNYCMINSMKPVKRSRKDKTILKATPGNMFSRIFANQMALTITLVLIQLALIIYMIIELTPHLYVLSIFSVIVSIILIIAVLSRDTDPSYKIAWIVIISLLPVFGAVLYLWIRLMPGPRSKTKKINRRMEEIAPHFPQNEAAVAELATAHLEFKGLATYLYRYGNYPTYKNTDLTYYPLGDDIFPAYLEAINNAKKFIFLEFFIIAGGQMWGSILDALKKKLNEGVEVRILYDGLNTLTTVPRYYYKHLRDYGFACRVFSPISSSLSPYQNSRDHRKILIVDGEVGFVGGVNLADEYINRLDRFGHWKDVGLRLQGAAVNSLTMQFLTMWHSLAIKETMIVEPYLNIAKTDYQRDNYVIPYADAPEDREERAETLLIEQLSDAKQYAYIYTPYLILNDLLKKALVNAAKRGVDVRIIIPHIPDKKIPFYIAKTMYKTLIAAGVKVYEYTPGFMHAKLIITDDRIVNIGSINFDFRSLYLNYENGVFILDQTFAQTCVEDFKETLAVSQQIDEVALKKVPKFQLLVGNIARFFEVLF